MGTFFLAAPNWTALGAAAQFGRARARGGASGGQQSHRSVAYDKHEAGKTTDDVAGAHFGNVSARFRCYYLGFFIF